jgi:hypothetical protein
LQKFEEIHLKKRKKLNEKFGIRTHNFQVLNCPKEERFYFHIPNQSKLQQKPQNFPDHPIDTPLDPANQISQTITEIQKILIQNKLRQPASQVNYQKIKEARQETCQLRTSTFFFFVHGNDP